MSLKDAFTISNKLSPHLRLALLEIDDGANRNEPMFTALLRVSKGPSYQAPPGVRITTTAGPILAAHNISINSLEWLVNDPRVQTIECTRYLPPEFRKPRKGLSYE